jgi:hypothetical protein
MADVKIRTATETLITCMEDFGEDEPQEVMVIYTTKSGDFAFSCSTDRLTAKLGMLEFCKAMILAKAFDKGGPSA